MDVLGLHYRKTDNLGDKYCHPLDYIHFGCSHDNKVVSKTLSTKLLKSEDPIAEVGFSPDVIIVGGGAISSKLPAINEAFPKAYKVAWGVGATKRGSMEVNSPFIHYNYRAGFALYGTREYLPNSGLDYVPCISCLHPFFYKIPSPTKDVVVYAHADFGNLESQARELNLPFMNNKDEGGIYTALSHIASGEVVITSSYHGAYWATLMGRKVAMIPFGSKFMSLKYRPPIIENIKKGIADAQSFSTALEDAKEKNIFFYEKVKQLIFS